MSQHRASASRREPIILPPLPRMVRPVRRRPWMIGALLVFAITLTAAFGTDFASRVAKPGSLSLPHAQILKGTLTKDRCAACHVNVSASSWSQMSTSGHEGMEIETATMTQRCMECHHNRIESALARSAHNLSADERLKLTQRLHRAAGGAKDTSVDAMTRRVTNDGLGDETRANEAIPNAAKTDFWGWTGWLTGARMPSAAIAQDDVACSVCHREHHGTHANLSAVTDAQCQSCHSRQFGSFATTHPEFNDYPAASMRTIAFDHVRHANLHFPKHADSNTPSGKPSGDSIRFDCRSCHVMNLGEGMDPVVGTMPFETACASCHDENLKVAISSGPALIALPILPDEVVTQLKSWPEDATGSPDGKLSAWMKLLLKAQEPTLNLDGLSDLGRVDWKSPLRQQQAVALGNAIRRFAIDLSVQGQPRLRDLALKAGANASTADVLARSFQPQLMRDAVKDWFGKANEPRADRISSRSSKIQLLHRTIKSGPNTNQQQGMTRLVAAGDDLLIDDMLIDEPFGGTNGVDDMLISGDPLADDPLLKDPLLEDIMLGDPWSEGLSREDSLAGDDPLLDDWSSGDDLLVTPGTSQDAPSVSGDWRAALETRFDPSTAQTLGGWYRDDLTLSLRYRGTGHSDPVLRILIELSKSKAPDLLEHSSLASCIECHDSGRSGSSLWKARGITGLRDRLTKFTHRPHLDIQGLQDCQHCHELNMLGSEGALASKAPLAAEIGLTTNHGMRPQEQSIASLRRSLGLVDRVFANVDGGAEMTFHLPSSDLLHPPSGDFLPLQKRACVACHTSTAAGDHCTTCHRYHVGDVR